MSNNMFKSNASVRALKQRIDALYEHGFMVQLVPIP